MNMSQENFLSGKAAEMSKTNPAEPPAKADPARKRIPMSLPHRRLAVPALPGYVLRWIRGDRDRLLRAQQAGYSFVERDEIEVGSPGIADNPLSDGNTDMGSRVSRSAGDSSEGLRLYLMKLPQEYWDEDQKEVDAQQEQIIDQLRGAGIPATDPDMDNTNRYYKPGNRNIFQPHKRT
jgi:hypothetical protein